MLEQSALWETKCSCVILMPECPCVIPVDLHVGTEFALWGTKCSCVILIDLHLGTVCFLETECSHSRDVLSRHTCAVGRYVS